jgi:atypical dual specificity phosphatase
MRASVAVPATRRRPSGFHWVLPGRLGGMARPGTAHDAAEDLAALRDLGVHLLVTLEEAPLDAERVVAAGLGWEHLPVPDMGTPSTAAALDLCRRITERMTRGLATVLHCRAGIGRTGAMLAACLVYGGMDALHAVEEVRAVYPHYVQSPRQMEFIHEFEAACRLVRSPAGEAERGGAR